MNPGSKVGRGKALIRCSAPSILGLAVLGLILVLGISWPMEDLRVYAAVWALFALPGYVTARVGAHFGFLAVGEPAALPIAQASTLLAFTRAGLGIQKLGWHEALAIAGVDSGEIVVFLVGQGAFTFLSILMLALPSRVGMTLFGSRAEVDDQGTTGKQ